MAGIKARSAVTAGNCHAARNTSPNRGGVIKRVCRSAARMDKQSIHSRCFLSSYHFGVEVTGIQNHVGNLLH